MRLSVDVEKCTLCGACVTTCPADMIRRKEDHIRIGRVACIECGHCVAICPEGAISDEEGERGQDLPGEVASPHLLEALIRRRRAVRRYLPQPVSEALIRDLLEATRWTPTAANCQAQEFLVLTDQAALADLRSRIEEHYRAFAEALADRERRAERLAELGLDPELAMHPHMLAAVPAFVKRVDAGEDRLFFGAPAVIIIHASQAQVMPDVACAYATMIVVLMAEAHGLGSCITGYASDALRTRADLRQALGLPSDHQVYQVIVLGWPQERFLRVPSRRPAQVQWW